MRTLNVKTLEEAREALASDALDFMLSGGRLTRTEWGKMDEIHRQAYVRAGEQFGLMRANAIAHEMLRQIDESMTLAAMERAMDKVGEA